MSSSYISTLNPSRLLSFAALAFLYITPPTRADDMYVWAEEVGDDVVFFHQGSIDITGFPDPGEGESFPAIQPNAGVFVLGITAVDVFSDVLDPGATRTFGLGGVAAGISASVQPFAADDSTRMALPDGYISGTPISGATTFEAADLETLGIDTTPFSFNTTVGSNTIHMFTQPPVQVDNSAAIAGLKKKIRKLRRKVRKLKRKGKIAKSKRLSKKVKRLKRQLVALG